MKILAINTSYDGGGAERVFRQLHARLSENHEVYCVVGYNRANLKFPDGSVSVLYQRRIVRALNRLVTKNYGNSSLSILYSYWKIRRAIKKHGIDVIHIHNAHGNYIGIRDIRRLAALAPVVWTVEDFWVVTGHCAIVGDCEQWRDGCRQCERLDAYPPVRSAAIARRLFSEKSRNLSGRQIVFVAPSDWLRQKLEGSYLQNERILTINHAVDERVWHVCDKEDLRARYGVDSSKRTIAFAAAQVGEHRKGMKLLLKALEQLNNPERYLLLIAGNSAGLEEYIAPLGIAYRTFGFIADDKKMLEFYALADILVNPTQEDIFGLVTIESMAAGTPVVAFDVCAQSEIISESGGWIVRENTPEALCRQIELVFDDPNELREKSAQCSKRAEDAFRLSDMIARYEALYRECVRGGRAEPER